MGNRWLKDYGSLTETGIGAFEWRIPDLFGKAEEYEKFISPFFYFSGVNCRVSLVELRKSNSLTFVFSNMSFCQWTVEIQTSNGTPYVSGTVSGRSNPLFLDLPLHPLKLKELRSVLVPSDTLTVYISGNTLPVSISGNTLPVSISGNTKPAPDYVVRAQSPETSLLCVRWNVDFKKQSTQTCPADGVPRPTSGTDDLSRNLKGLLESTKFSDATIRVKAVDFRVHRAILASRTPVFDAMFRHDTSENASGVVDIEDCEPDIFRKFLEYVYTGKLEELSTKNAADLYQIADKYQIDKLKEECLQRLNSGLSVQTFCHVIRLSLRHDERELTEKATDFFVTYASEIVQTVEWQIFMVENPTWANELIVKGFKAVKR